MKTTRFEPGNKNLSPISKDKSSISSPGSKSKRDPLKDTSRTDKSRSSRGKLTEAMSEKEKKKLRKTLSPDEDDPQVDPVETKK
jgi:hypothetical protein